MLKSIFYALLHNISKPVVLYSIVFELPVPIKENNDKEFTI